MKKKKVLIITAHPDDETIWMGGTILKNKDNWNATIITLCRKSDPDRCPKYKKVCKALNLKPHILDFEDTRLDPLDENEIIDAIRKITKQKKFDITFTHGRNGEYGHPRHIEVHRAITKMLQKGILSSTKTFFFSYVRSASSCRADKSSDKFISLNDIQLAEKKHLIHKIYGFDRGSFEVKSSKKIEAFKLYKK